LWNLTDEQKLDYKSTALSTGALFDPGTGEQQQLMIKQRFYEFSPDDQAFYATINDPETFIDPTKTTEKGADVVAYHPMVDGPLNQKDMCSLGEDKELSDQIMNLYIHTLKTKYLDCHFFSTQFSGWLYGQGTYNFDMVSHMTHSTNSRRNFNVNIFKMRFVFVITHLPNHWATRVICPPLKAIFYLDSNMPDSQGIGQVTYIVLHTNTYI
jgi:hypothetical protein